MGKGKTFDRAITDFAASYADQVTADYTVFTAAIAEGRIQAHEDAPGAEGLRAAKKIAARPTKKPRARTKT
jgi:hypothetical protein